MSVTVITPERRQIALERTLPLVLLRREDEEEAHRIGDEKIGSLREIRRDSSEPKLETLIRDSKKEGERPNTVEAYVRIVMSNMNVQGIGDVPVYGYMTYTVGGSEVKSERSVVNTNQGSGYVEVYNSNMDSQQH